MLAPAGQPRHPRPAGVQLEINALYAADYGVRGDGDRGLVPMDLGPLLDAVAARYDGCQPCEAHQVAAIAASPPLTTHAVGVALLTLTPVPGSEAPARLVIQKLDPAGAAIALTIRARGLLAAVGAARAMSDAHRRAAIAAALGTLLPVHWYHQYVSNQYLPEGDRSAVEPVPAVAAVVCVPGRPPGAAGTLSAPCGRSHLAQPFALVCRTVGGAGLRGQPGPHG
jgi:hypothetical protein